MCGETGLTLIQGLLLGASTIVLGLMLFPVFDRGRDGGYAQRSPCQTHLKQIGLAMKQYLHDNDERHPSLESVAGWREALRPFTKDETVFQCPEEGNQVTGTTDYWFNSRLSGVSEASLDLQALTVIFGDGYATADPGVAISHLPQGWIDDPKSPARRHLGGLNFVFADGHAKWLRPEKVGTEPTAKGGSTFAFN